MVGHSIGGGSIAGHVHRHRRAEQQAIDRSRPQRLRKDSVIPAWNTYSMQRLIVDSAGVEIAETREGEHVWNWALILALMLCLAFWALLILGLSMTIL